MKGDINITATQASEKQDLASMVDEWVNPRDGNHGVAWAKNGV